MYISLYQIYNHLSVDVMLSINKSDNKQLLLSNTSQIYNLYLYGLNNYMMNNFN